MRIFKNSLRVWLSAFLCALGLHLGDLVGRSIRLVLAGNDLATLDLIQDRSMLCWPYLVVVVIGGLAGLYLFSETRNRTSGRESETGRKRAEKRSGIEKREKPE